MAKGNMRVRVRDIDHGWEAFQRTVHKLARQRPRVVTGITGVHGASIHHSSKELHAVKSQERSTKRRAKKGQAPKPFSLQLRGHDSVADIARKNEFGIGVPERSFLRANFDQHRDAYQRYLINGLRREVIGAAQGGTAVDTHSSVTLKRLALKVEGDVKRKIRSRVPPPNAPSTIRSKKSSTPLIDTGQLIGALASEIRKAGAA